MPKKAKELGPLHVKRLRHPGKGGNVNYSVGGVDGLQLQVTPTNARSWLLRTMVAGKRRNIGLGSYPTVSLAQAREAARETREQVRKGIDPVEWKRQGRAELAAQQARQLTFAAAMEQFLEVKLKEFKNEKHRKQWRASLDTYAVPIIGSKPVAEITVQDVLSVLNPIWTTKTETASRLRGRIEGVMAWSTVKGHRDGDNPARWRGNLDAVLPKPGKVATVKHHPALALKDATEWFSDLRNRQGVAARALEFLALTAARSGEVRGATWDEIDLERKLWIIPAERMKARREHRVPMVEEAIVLLQKLPKIGNSPFVFPAVRGGPLSDMALSACMRRINATRDGGFLDPRSGRPAVPHGLRSTFRDWAAEQTDYPPEMAEIALAHTVGSEVERAYRRTDLVEKRRSMLGKWAEYLDRGARPSTGNRKKNAIK
ncbi:MAG: integrase arm-type DNA-binding domain-containing protein [Silicimonas sp.]|nr:integrase arm-type DNA-binding domain-containing protein [Silicimonas sp.]